MAPFTASINMYPFKCAKGGDFSCVTTWMSVMLTLLKATLLKRH